MHTISTIPNSRCDSEERDIISVNSMGNEDDTVIAGS